ncbi:uncharacterized protein PG998_006433 [Apiospora kogelbergensis]|uniref:uncharacterized protein n=1 Tax=Apiospora kogelbergensis TaxID=1337665 RepID=UPI00312EA364
MWLSQLRLRYRPGRAAGAACAGAAPPVQAGVLVVSVLHEVEALHPLSHTRFGWCGRIGDRSGVTAALLRARRLPVRLDARISGGAVLRPRPRALGVALLVLFIVVLARRQRPGVLVPGGVPAVPRHRRFSNTAESLFLRSSTASLAWSSSMSRNDVWCSGNDSSTATGLQM